jgi:hypothetical protein
MNITKRHKQFVAIASVATIITVCSHVNVFGLALQPYPTSPNGTQATLVAENKQTGSTTEEIGRSCLATNEATGAELIGEYQKPNSNELFQVWELNIAGHSVLTIHSLLGTTCLHAYDERYNNSLADDLSQEDAQQLSLILYQHQVEELGSLEALQAQFDAEARELAQYGESGYLPAESIWALNELGIRLSDVYEVFDPANPPQRSRSPRGEI